tara:strand:+ start:495 stop:812 length:318 start_codon:yes stop_codon:yes gene_type:complete
MSGFEEYSTESVREAVVTYSRIHPKIRHMKNPEKVERVLKRGEYSAYIRALNTLRESTLSGDEIVNMLLHGDESDKRYDLIVRTFSNKTNSAVNLECLGYEREKV